MKQLLTLRQVAPNIARLSSLQARIKGGKFRLFTPVNSRRYFKFTLSADTIQCEAMLDVVAWLERELAEPDTLAWQEIDEFYLSYLLGLKVPTLSFPELEVSELVVSDIHIVSGADIPGEKIEIASAIGKLLFADLPEQILPPRPFIPPLKLQVPLKFLLGNSQWRINKLPLVSTGDLLLIQQYKPQVYIASQLAFGFRLLEEGNIMLEEYSENFNDSENASDEDNPIASDLPAAREPFNIKKIECNMSFLLQQQNKTLAEISAICAGEILPMPPDAEQNITILVNNQRFAQGELIQVGDNLAVEVKTLYANDTEE